MFVLILHHIVWGGTPHISSAPTQGHPSPGRSAPPRSASESVRADTLRALPENAAAPALMHGHSKAPDAQPLAGRPSGDIAHKP